MKNEHTLCLKNHPFYYHAACIACNAV